MKKNRDLLLVIDMQNVYLPEEEWACPTMKESIKNVRKILDSKTGCEVLFTQYLPWRHPFGRWEEYNREYRSINENPWLSEICEDLKPYTDHVPVITKSTYSSLKAPEVLHAAVRADRLVLAGVVAECCVLATMMEAVDFGIPVIYLTDCCSGQTPEKEQRVLGVCDSLSPVHIRMMTSDEYLAEGL